MSELLAYSLFQDIFFPDINNDDDQGKAEDFLLQQLIRFSLDVGSGIGSFPIVVFDFETTGLDSRADEIIEVGAIKLVDFKPVAQMSSLIKPAQVLPDLVTKISGITADMLEGQPSMAEVMPKFLEFISGSMLVAHNADFDMAFLSAACAKMGYLLSWPCVCTLKMARSFLPQLESKNLDTLAKYYDLEFESRHRSIGDVKVTSAVLQNLLTNEGKELLRTWGDLQPFAVVKE